MTICAFCDRFVLDESGLCPACGSEAGSFYRIGLTDETVIALSGPEMRPARRSFVKCSRYKKIALPFTAIRPKGLLKARYFARTQRSGLKAA